jgi:hypothetical protein
MAYSKVFAFVAINKGIQNTNYYADITGTTKGMLKSAATALGESRTLWQQLGQCREIRQLGLTVAHRTCR